LRNLIKYLKDIDVRKRKSKIGKELVDGKGGLRIRWVENNQ